MGRSPQLRRASRPRGGGEKSAHPQMAIALEITTLAKWAPGPEKSGCGKRPIWHFQGREAIQKE
jgi:hypothetical protein